MKLKLVAAFILITGFLSFPTSAQEAKKPLTNADITRMTQRGLKEDIIIRAIKTSANNFDVSPDALIQLHDSKVSDKVIEAMQEAAQATQANKVTSADNRSDSTKPNKPKVEVHLFSIELERCFIKGTVVACLLNITNDAKDRDFYISIHGTRLIDNYGNEVGASNLKLANDEGERVSRVIVEGQTVHAWIVFPNVDSTASKLARLDISIAIGNNAAIIMGFDYFTIQFRNILLEKQSDSKK